MTIPKISVIMPVYNASKYLEIAIKSILDQTYKDFELIILNDKSTDSSLDIIKKMMQIDTRIILVDKEKNCGPAELRNEGINIAKGTFIALMDADDISLPERFEKQIAILEGNLEIGVCGSWFTKFGDNYNEEIIIHYEFHPVIKLNFLIDCCIGNPTTMFRKSIIKDNRYETKFVPMEDYDLWSKLINHTQFYNIQESLLMYRWHETNISHSSKSNLFQLHQSIRINQLNDFLIIETNPDAEYYLKAIHFSEKQEPNDIIKILKCRNYLIEQNININKYDKTLFINQLDKSIKKTLIRAKFYNLKLLRYLLNEESEIFKTLKLKYQFKIILKSFFINF